MKIIIEGCDGSGKSTLARRLASIFNAKIEHDSTPCPYSNYMQRLKQSGNVIFDRFFLGQFVYNPFEERQMGTHELVELIDYCHKQDDIIMIYMNTDTDVILQRLQGRSEKEKIRDKEIISKLGFQSLEDFVTTIKERYSFYTGHFINLKGDDINYE